MRPRRQDWSGELTETGMFYFTRRSLIEIDGMLQNERFECKLNDILKNIRDRNETVIYFPFFLEFLGVILLKLMTSMRLKSTTTII